MRAAGANRFTGTMSDAVTPVDVRVQGRTATLQYKVKGGISVNQTLTIRDSNTVTNHVAAKKLGVRLGRLEGTIRKLD
jgi:cytoskeletal protein CcmA (bactofilin family)